jgi:hypothetical protein
VGATKGDEAEAVGEHFVLDNGGVLVDENVFNGQGRNFSEEDAAESIGDGGVDASKREFGVVGFVAVELNVEVLELVLVYVAYDIVYWK